MSLLLEIITPDKVVLSEEVDSVILPTIEGESGILPGHVPYLTAINPGELLLTKKGNTEYLAVDKGFVLVQGDKVSVLSQGAIDLSKVDMATAEEAVAKAQEAYKEAKKQEDVDPEELEHLAAIERFAMTQRVAKTKHLRKF